jgi:pimeloyl-ACP methyl ester carboxylesterase
MTTYTHDTVPTEFVEANGVRFAYRGFGATSGVPLVFIQHFMGNLDDHDPVLTDAFAVDREVILFNNAGIASSTGTTPDTIEQTARDTETFIDAIGFDTVDLLAHSMGGLVAQQVAFDRPELVRRLVLVGTPVRQAHQAVPRRRVTGVDTRSPSQSATMQRAEPCRTWRPSFSYL